MRERLDRRATQEALCELRLGRSYPASLKDKRRLINRSPTACRRRYVQPSVRGADTWILEHFLGFRRFRAFTQEVIRSAQGAYLSAAAAAMNWLSDTPSVAANSAAAFFTDVGSFNG